MNKQEDRWYDIFIESFPIRVIEVIFLVSMALFVGIMIGGLIGSDSVEKTHRTFIELGCGQYNSVTGAFEYINRNDR
jgi:hypothetical protein